MGNNSDCQLPHQLQTQQGDSSDSIPLGPRMLSIHSYLPHGAGKRQGSFSSCGHKEFQRLRSQGHQSTSAAYIYSKHMFKRLSFIISQAPVSSIKWGLDHAGGAYRVHSPYLFQMFTFLYFLPVNSSLLIFPYPALSCTSHRSPTRSQGSVHEVASFSCSTFFNKLWCILYHTVIQLPSINDIRSLEPLLCISDLASEQDWVALLCLLK